MPSDLVLGWAGSALSGSLRLAPVFAFAPPFTLLRMPARVRLLMVLTLAACMASAQAPLQPTDATFFARAGLDLLAGLGVALALQLAFAALSFVGRLIDVQAGHGLAMLIDPATRAQSPLMGTLFGLAAGVAFFEMNAHHVVLRALAAPAASSTAVTLVAAGDLSPLLAYLGSVFSAAFGAGATILVVLFAIDLAIAFVSRSLPQMNVLMLGLQVKALALLVVAAGSVLLLGPALLAVLRQALSFAGG